MKVTIIIPNYNGRHFLKKCLDSLFIQTYQSYKILIIDNASTDDSLSYLAKEYPQIETIALSENYGFSKAVNVGIQQADTPYVILLNNDTAVDTNYVKELVTAIESSKRIFSVSSKMLQMHHPELIDSAGDLYTLMGWGVCRGAGRPATNYQDTDEVFTACAGASIYRRNVFRQIGYFDESHFAYLEDIDVGYRGKIYGYKNMYCPSAIVYHVGSGTSGSKYNTFKVKLSARNSVYLNYKNMPFFQLLLNAVPLVLGYGVKYLFFCKIGFGTDYKDGIKEGIQNLANCKKVPFQFKHLGCYIKIQWELLVNTVAYAKDWFSRKLFQK